MTVDLFGAFERYFGGSKNNAQFEDGVIQSIIGNTALVRVSGSDRVQECYYSKGSNLEPGDRCILMRTSRNARWTVVSGFGTSYGGNNPQNAAPPAPNPDTIYGNVVTNNFGAISNVNLNVADPGRLVASVNITTNGGLILAYGGAELINNTGTTGHSAALRLTVDGGTHFSGPSITPSGTGGQVRLPAHVIYPFAVTPGVHTIGLYARAAGANWTIPAGYLWACEIGIPG